MATVIKPIDGTDIVARVNGEILSYQTYLSYGEGTVEVHLLLSDTSEVKEWMSKIGDNINVEIINRKNEVEEIVDSFNEKLTRVESSLAMEENAWIRLAFGESEPTNWMLLETSKQIARDYLRDIMPRKRT